MFDSRTRMKNVTDASMMAIAQLVTVSTDRGTRISLSRFRSQDRSTIYSTGATVLTSEAAAAAYETRLFERPDFSPHCTCRSSVFALSPSMFRVQILIVTGTSSEKSSMVRSLSNLEISDTGEDIEGYRRMESRSCLLMSDMPGHSLVSTRPSF